MNALRNVVLVGVGMVLALLLVWGASAALAQGPDGTGHAWMMGAEAGMMQGDMDHVAMHDGTGMMQRDMDHTAMHAAMHDGEEMPADCPVLAGEGGMRDRMMQHMHHEMPETPAE